MALAAYDRIVGLELPEDVAALDCCITKAPCGGEKVGRSPVDRGKRGTKRSTAVDARGIRLGTAVTAPANRHDSPLLAETLDAVAETLGGLAEGTSVHLDRGYDSGGPPASDYESAGLWPRSPGRASPPRSAAPLGATKRWVVERTGSWHNAHKKLVLWCTQRRGRVVDFWVASSRRPGHHRQAAHLREGWTRYRWEGRPSRRP